jgi:hypothetical protein
VNELVREIKEREAELESIFGGGAARKSWSRRPKAGDHEQEGSPAA